MMMIVKNENTASEAKHFFDDMMGKIGGAQILDEIYRMVLREHVMIDIEEYSKSEGIEVDNVEELADRYVYDGDYDCNLSYWQNLDNLIKGV